MRIDYKTRLELDAVQWLKTFSAATGRPQTDIVNEALEQYRESLAPVPAKEPQDDREAFTPPVPPKDAREVPPEPQGVSAGFSGEGGTITLSHMETLPDQIARLTAARDNVHMLPDATAAAKREEFERLDGEIRSLQAQQIAADLERNA
jgi:hypothetical protein